MKIYKLLHKPTGLYYRPVRSIKVKVPHEDKREYVKSNLCKKGKIHTIKPNLDWCEWIADHTQVVEKNNPWGYKHFVSKTIKTSPDDWEIIEMQMI